MNLTLQQLLEQAEQLPASEQLELISRLAEQLHRKSTKAAKPKRKIGEFFGVAPNLLNGEDAQEWVNQLRDEWSDREDALTGRG